jgi:hypothetical protein
MGKIEDILLEMKHNPRDVRFKDLCKVCDFYSVKLVKQEAAIGYTKLRGRAIHG